VVRDRPFELAARQHEDARFESMTLRHRGGHLLRQAAGIRSRVSKNDVAALDVRLHRGATVLLAQQLEILHRQHVVAADVDATNQRDIDVHEAALTNDYGAETRAMSGEPPSDPGLWHRRAPRGGRVASSARRIESDPVEDARAAG